MSEIAGVYVGEPVPDEEALGAILGRFRQEVRGAPTDQYERKLRDHRIAAAEKDRDIASLRQRLSVATDTIEGLTKEVNRLRALVPNGARAPWLSDIPKV